MTTKSNDNGARLIGWREEWHKTVRAAQNATHELVGLQSTWAELSASGHLTADEKAFLNIVEGFDLDEIENTLLECESRPADVNPIEDGDTPTPEPDFIDEDEDRRAA